MWWKLWIRPFLHYVNSFLLRSQPMISAFRQCPRFIFQAGNDFVLFTLAIFRLTKPWKARDIATSELEARGLILWWTSRIVTCPVDLAFASKVIPTAHGLTYFTTSRSRQLVIHNHILSLPAKNQALSNEISTTYTYTYIYIYIMYMIVYVYVYIYIHDSTFNIIIIINWNHLEDENRWKQEQFEIFEMPCKMILNQRPRQTLLQITIQINSDRFRGFRGFRGPALALHWLERNERTTLGHGPWHSTWQCLEMSRDDNKSIRV